VTFAAAASFFSLFLPSVSLFLPSVSLFLLSPPGADFSDSSAFFRASDG